MSVQLYARDVGAGTPLVLLHAFPLSSAMWLDQREGLADRFRVITPDLRGFGGSLLGTDEPSIDAMADDVAAVMQRLGVTRAVVGGASMGGYVAMALCRRRPDLVPACRCWWTRCCPAWSDPPRCGSGPWSTGGCAAWCRRRRRAPPPGPSAPWPRAAPPSTRCAG